MRSDVHVSHFVVATDGDARRRRFGIGRLAMLGDRPRQWLRAPLTWVLLSVLILHAVGIGWGLPATDGWDDDGVAPRDFLVGVVKTFTPGDYYTYPPFHLLLLTLLTCPAWIVGLVHARSLSPPDLVQEFLDPKYMTAFALTARALAVAMSLGLVWALAKVGEELHGRRAGVLVAAVVGLNAPFAYYSHTSNLEVPYCFWGAIALLQLVRAVVRAEPARLRWAAVAAALAIATKDQSAGLFLLSAPVALAWWWAVDPRARSNGRVVGREILIACALGIGIVVLVDGALFNPSGFAARIRFLFGSASRDHASYAPTWLGRLALVRDSARDFSHFYPAPFALLALGGIGFALVRSEGARRVGAAIPLLFALSFFVLFNGFALRSDERFLLPQMLILGFYAGIGLHAMLATTAALALVSRVLAVALLSWALFECAAVDVVLLYDPRYDAEDWLSAHVVAGDVLEVYGNQVYLPRLPPQAHVVRVDQKPIAARNPLLGATEILGRYEDAEARHPRWIVVADNQLWAYLSNPADAEKEGRVRTPGQHAAYEDVPARRYFEDLVAGRGGYKVAHVSRWTSKIWPAIEIHSSTGHPIRVFERAE